MSDKPLTSPMALSDREVGAGTDPGSGLAVLDLQGLTALGIEVPDQRYLLHSGTAAKLGAQLLLAANPGLAVPALTAIAAQAALHAAQKGDMGGVQQVALQLQADLAALDQLLDRRTG